MKPLTEHIKEVHKKPHNVRKQITFATAGGVTAVIALLWLSTSLSAGTFALKDTSFADAVTAEGVVTVSRDGSEGLAGAAAAPATRPANAPARIEIVTVASSSTVEAEEPTILPF